MERRSFFQWLFLSISAIWGIGLAGVVAKYLRAPETSRAGESDTIRVGPLESLRVGVPQFFAHARQPVFILRLPSNEVVAVSAICTHFHCILKWQSGAKVYQCPCHQGSFDPHGNVLAGPPPSPLPKLTVEHRRGEVYVRLV